MEKTWVETRINLDVVEEGKTIQLENVRALQNSRTGKVLVYPWDVSKAEMETIAKNFKIWPRDLSAMMLLIAKPGPFKEGAVLYKYHLQKMAFYLWKTLEKKGCYDSIPRDDFIPAKNGPVPEHMNEDLERFEKEGLIEIKVVKIKDHNSKRIILTDKGLKLASDIWRAIPEEYRNITDEVKKEIYPLDPDEVRERVHKEYPEYRDTYIENDIE